MLLNSIYNEVTLPHYTILGSFAYHTIIWCYIKVISLQSEFKQSFSLI
jgi:hypothetical protein